MESDTYRGFCCLSALGKTSFQANCAQTYEPGSAIGRRLLFSLCMPFLPYPSHAFSHDITKSSSSRQVLSVEKSPTVYGSNGLLLHAALVCLGTSSTEVRVSLVVQSVEQRPNAPFAKDAVASSYYNATIALIIFHCLYLLFLEY